MTSEAKLVRAARDRVRARYTGDYRSDGDIRCAINETALEIEKALASRPTLSPQDDEPIKAPPDDGDISDEYLDALQRHVDAQKPADFKLTPIAPKLDEGVIAEVKEALDAAIADCGGCWGDDDSCPMELHQKLLRAITLILKEAGSEHVRRQLREGASQGIRCRTGGGYGADAQGKGRGRVLRQDAQDL